MVLITAFIEALEWHDVVVTDILEAFLSAHMYKVVHMKLCGPLALKIVKLVPVKFGDKSCGKIGSQYFT